MDIYLTNRQDNFGEVRKAFSEYVEANNDPDVQYMMLMVNDEVVCVSNWHWDLSISQIRRMVSAAQVVAENVNWGTWSDVWDNGWVHTKAEIEPRVTVHYLRG